MRPCCQEPENRRIVAREPDRVVEQCLVCGAKHIELVCEPGKFGITLKG